MLYCIILLFQINTIFQHIAFKYKLLYKRQQKSIFTEA